MSDHTPSPAPRAGSHRSRRRGVLWASGAVAALILVLGTSGTLSSWTSAVLANDTNTAKTTTAVILREVSGANTCFSSDDATTNTSTCTTINTYGATASPLVPGGSQTVDVVFTNVGAANASSFALAPGSCTQTPTAGTLVPPVANLCTSGDLTVSAKCSPGGTYSSATAWSDLSYSAAAPPTATKSHPVTSSDLNAGATWACQFVVTLSGTASVLGQNVVVTQPLTWTLTKA